MFLSQLSHILKLDFVAIKRVNYSISLGLIFLSIISIFFLGFNFGIDFTGGVNIDVRMKEKHDIEKIRTILASLDIGEIVIQNYDDLNDLSIKIGSDLDDDVTGNIEMMKSLLKENFGDIFDYRKVEVVGGTVGADMIRAGITATILSFIGIMIYIWFRFELQFSIGVLVALFHDIVVSLGFISITQCDFNLSTIAGLLTIMGYSVNNSVVIYDRIRENLRKHQKMPLIAIVNTSINQTLSRTIITSFTTLIANLTIIIFGGMALKTFSMLVFFGILIGTYSSIFISSPILTSFNIRRNL